MLSTTIAVVTIISDASFVSRDRRSVASIDHLFLVCHLGVRAGCQSALRHGFEECDDMVTPTSTRRHIPRSFESRFTIPTHTETYSGVRSLIYCSLISQCASTAMPVPTNLIYRRIMIMFKYCCQKHRLGIVQPTTTTLQWIRIERTLCAAAAYPLKWK